MVPETSDVPYDMTAVHVSEKQLIVADTPSRSPSNQEAEATMDQDGKAFVVAVITNKLLTPVKLNKIRNARQNDPNLQTVITCIWKGWLRRMAKFSPAHGYHAARNHLSESAGLVLYQDRSL